jgi:hypothetical protein
LCKWQRTENNGDRRKLFIKVQSISLFGLSQVFLGRSLAVAKNLTKSLTALKRFALKDEKLEEKTYGCPKIEQ